MKLLIITQSVDRDDTALGFFHEWIRAFSGRVEEVLVICLKEGKHNLPPNVKVLSLGKEVRKSRIRYLFNFYRFIFRERDNYDSVLVHMNQEYVLLGGIFWRMWRKKIGFWYNHTHGSIKTDVAAFIAQEVFYVSPHAYMTRKEKARIMPAGIDVDFFIPDAPSARRPDSVLFLGRISPIKRVREFEEALILLFKKRPSARATICGDAASRDEAYRRSLEDISNVLSRDKNFIVLPGVSHWKTKNLYATHELYVNLTQTGSMDKTILEAMAMGSLVLVLNRSFVGILPADSIVNEPIDPAEVAQKMAFQLSLSAEDKLKRGDNFRDYVLRSHSLGKLVLGVLKVLGDE